MGGSIVLSEKSQQLIKELLNADFPYVSNPEYAPSSESTVELIKWLTIDITIPETISKSNKEKIEFILASLRTELLRDLLISIQGINLLNNKMEEEPPFGNQVQFVLLAIAGTLLAACEGFDSIASLMSVLSFPALAILAAGVVFSALSIFVFYGFDLVQVSQNLGIKLKDAPKLLDVYLLQMEEIKAIRRTIESYNLVTLSIKDLEHNAFIITMLQKRLKDVRLASGQFDSALNNEDMALTETIVSWVAGLLFFGSGFFAGQSVAIFFLGLFMTTVAPTFWPVVLFSLGIGVAAFGIYWNVERVGIKALIGTWFGLEEEKIKELCDPDKLVNEDMKLKNLLEHVLSSSALVSELAALKQINTIHTEHPGSQFIDPEGPNDQKNPVMRTSNNIYSFHQRFNNQESNHSDLDYDEVSGYSNS